MNQEYIYEYANGERIRNLGFIKQDKQPDKCIIQIYARDIDDVKGILFQDATGKRYIGSWEPEELKQEVPHIEETDMEIEEYIPPSNTSFEKIQRRDLSRLPRKEWRLANNSFLLHGFYNYHHLLYIEEDGDVWIGVPGIFHEKEKLAANTFGFTHFRRQSDVPVELDESEKNSFEDFGYWCRQIGNPQV